MILMRLLVILITLFKLECVNDCRRIARQLKEVRQHQCELTSQNPTGPFYIDYNRMRSDIHEYRPGVPLKLTLYFTDAKTCKPLRRLWISVWSADAVGYYSHYTKLNPSVTYQGPLHAPETDKSQFLRGIQRTDRDGKVIFNTLLPGWYANFTHHIHFKIYGGNSRAVFTGRLFFTEDLGDFMYKIFPYYVQKRVYNKDDYLYTDYKGVESTVNDIKPINSERMTDGFTAQIVIGLLSNSTDLGDILP